MSTSEERLRTGILSGHKPKTIQETAYRLIDEGFFPTILYPAGIVVPPKTEPEEGKRPMRKGWGLERITYAIVDECLKRYRKAGVGLCLGPGKGPRGRWLVDIEGDGPEAKASRAKLFGEDASGSLGWGSARGGHELRFGDEDRLGAILQALAPRGKDAKGQEPGVLHLPELPDLELRLGMPGKQLQSACPPTVGTDGQPRQWNDVGTIAELPDAAYEFLEAIARTRAAASNGQHKGDGRKPRGLTGRDYASADPVVAYLATAIADEAARVSYAQPGERHNTLRSASWTLAGLRWCDDFDWAAARKALEAAGESIGLPDGEIAELLDGAEARPDERRPDGLLDAIARRERERQERSGRDGRAERDGQAEAGEADGPDRRPIVECHDRCLDAVTAEVIAALGARNDPPETFNFGDQLAWIKTASDDGRAIIETMSGDAVRNRMADVAVFEETRETKKGSVRQLVFPPRDVMRAVMAQKTWPVRMAPPLEMIAESPRFLPEGRLVTTPGYHPDIRIFYNPPPDLLSLEIPDRPTTGQVDEAKALIFGEYLADFPFADDASKANALACMLLPFVRLMIPGPTPLHMFEASTEGTGKGKLANACAYPGLGRDLHSSSQKEDEAEWRKAITTALMPGPSHIYFDNLYNPRLWDGSMVPIDSANLALALTQPEWVDRILGGNREARIKIRCVWMASGNNIEWSKELIRRVVPIRLIAITENPSERTGFRHDPLERWAAENRRELLRACLVLCRNWIVEDCTPGKQVMGSYEEYARVMGGVLDAACVPGFLDNRKRGMGKDRESIRWVALVKAWWAELRDITTASSQLHDVITRNQDLHTAFADILGDGSPLSQKQKLGNALQKQAGRVWGDHRVVRCAQKGTGGTVRYRLAPRDELMDEDPEPEAK